MERGRQITEVARVAGIATRPGMVSKPDAYIDEDRPAGVDDFGKLQRAVRETQPLGVFDARAVQDLNKAAPTDSNGLRRTIRRSELRQIVPLADSTIYEMERRGDFPQRFFLTARCVVWDLAEVLDWLQSRRTGGSDKVKKAPMPDYRKRGLKQNAGITK